MVNDENLEKYQPLMEYLTEIGQEKGATPGELSLAWILHKKPYIVPIPGSRKVTRLEENLCSSEIRLSAEEINKIDEKLDQMDFLVFGGNQAK